MYNIIIDIISIMMMCTADVQVLCARTVIVCVYCDGLCVL